MNCKNCMFSICWAPSNLYRVTAFVDEMDIMSESIKSMNISNNADLNKETNLDVLGVCILYYKDLLNIPNNLSQFFPNMIALDMSGCGLKKVTRNDLRNLINLTEIRLCQMDIEELPDDLFDDLVNLEIIELQKNKIKFIGKNTFESLRSVKYIDLRGNPSINAIFASEGYEVDEDLSVARLLKLDELNGLIKVYFHSPTTGGAASGISEEGGKEGNASNDEKSAESIRKEEEIASNGVTYDEANEENLEESKEEASASAGALSDDGSGSEKLNESPNSSRNSPNENIDDWVVVRKEEGFLPCHTSICHDVQTLLQIDEFRDFTLSINDVKFKVHKFILVARSPTFADLVRNNPDADNLKLKNIGVEVFKIILDYIYNDRMPEGYNEYSARLFVAAGKLKLEALKLHVGKILSEIVEPANCLDLLKIGSFYNHDELKQNSFIEIKKLHPDKSFNDESMNNIEMIMKIIDEEKK